ncbi:hypothetical protein [Actinomyces culturomici]|uniref:hypothetical protein n=1 Tax=Actinomyces culturomici TaxID=1926276 RepID=UPI00135CA5D0|nr:hypothetical protein [Actinomyces culturomici]
MNADDPHTDRAVLITVPVLSALPLVFLACYLRASRSQLPATLTVHWGPLGEANGKEDLASFIAFAFVLSFAWLLLAAVACGIEALGRHRVSQFGIVKYVALAGVWTTVGLESAIVEANARSRPADLNMDLYIISILIGPAIAILVAFAKSRIRVRKDASYSEA